MRTAAEIIDVGVLGSINRDTIEHADGRRETGLGGVAFTAAALAHLAAGKVRTWLFARVAADLRPRLERALAGAPGLSFDGLLEAPSKGYRCHIRYAADGSKTEVLSGAVPPLTAADLATWLPRLRGLLVNFITGFELSLDELRRIRAALRGPLLMDVHSLTLGRDSDGRRYPRPLENWQEWIAQADVVQLNEAEATCLGGPADAALLADWAASLLDLGPQVAVITRGDEGSVASYRAADGSVHCLSSPAQQPPVDAVIDPTGCGDVFLAGLGFGLLSGADPPAAVALATRAAARNCILTGIDDLDRLV